MTKKFRKKPVVVEAIQYDGTKDCFLKLNLFTDYIIKNPEGTKIWIPTLEGDMQIKKGDWVIKGVNGEFYPCKPNIFKKTYEEVI